MDLTRRDLLALGGLTLAASAVAPSAARATAPKRGGEFRFRGYTPPHFDPHLTASYTTMINLSFTHSRLLRHKAGPDVKPGVFGIEGDLAESWTQPDEKTYVFKLRKGVRWHKKPPVNGRELTADDVKYTFDRFMTIKGNANRHMMNALDRVDVADKHTVKFSLKEPNAWFLDFLSNPMALSIVAREAVEQFGDLKKPEAVIGTGPWVLERHEPKVRTIFVRHPDYFRSGLPYIERVEGIDFNDPAARLAAFVTGQLDAGPEFPGMMIRRQDWKIVKEKRPNLRYVEFPSNVMTHVGMRIDKKPWDDIRVRRAMSMAVDRKAILVATAEGVGVMNPPVPAALSAWSIPHDQLGEGLKYDQYDPAEAKRLLKEAGLGGGFSTTLEYATYGSQELIDAVQMCVKFWKDVGVDVKVVEKPYAAFFATAYQGKQDALMMGPQFPALDPYNFLAQYLPGEPKNQSHVNDPALADMIMNSSRTLDDKKRRQQIDEIQKHIARQAYYVRLASGIYIAALDPKLENFGPNLGYDYGGRLSAAWWNT
ncbi:MAG: ABC transporter substrate-binding protein [Candidatus Rokubacteria bacterium]|nr:ABC transporter substrate-binding protein [Candidatus Rokubacteria bacterium]